MSLMPVFDKFTEEAKIIGKMVVGYGELEYDWMLCVSLFLGDTQYAVRTLYRLKSESSRLQVGDALLRPFYASHQLDNEYQQLYVAMKHCKNIRNNYAHCHWGDAEDKLMIVLVEKAAISLTGEGDIDLRYVDLALLKQQLAYFEYCASLLFHLQYEPRVRQGKVRANPLQLPKVLQPPPQYIRQGSLPSRMIYEAE